VYGSFEKLWSGPVGIFPAKCSHTTHVCYCFAWLKK